MENLGSPQKGLHFYGVWDSRPPKSQTLLSTAWFHLGTQLSPFFKVMPFILRPVDVLLF